MSDDAENKPCIWSKIVGAFPELAEDKDIFRIGTAIRLQDDGNGPYIAIWNYKPDEKLGHKVDKDGVAILSDELKAMLTVPEAPAKAEVARGTELDIPAKGPEPGKSHLAEFNLPMFPKADEQ